MPYRRCGRSALDLPAISVGPWQNFGCSRRLRSVNRPGSEGPRVTSALIGACSIEQLDDSLSAAKNLVLSDDQLSQIDQAPTDAGIDIWKASSSIRSVE